MAREGLSRAEELDSYYQRAWLASVPRLSMKMLQIASVKIDWPRLESGHRPLFNLVPGNGRLREPFRLQHGTSDLWSWIRFPLDNLKKFKKIPSRTTPPGEPTEATSRGGTIAASKQCADYDPYMETRRIHEMQAPTEQDASAPVKSPSQASGSLGLAPCSTYSSSMATPRETHGLRPRRSEAHIDTQCRDPLPGVALCGLAAGAAFPRARSIKEKALSPREQGNARAAAAMTNVAGAASTAQRLG